MYIYANLRHISTSSLSVSSIFSPQRDFKWEACQSNVSCRELFLYPIYAVISCLAVRVREMLKKQFALMLNGAALLTGFNGF